MLWSLNESCVSFAASGSKVSFVPSGPRMSERPEFDPIRERVLKSAREIERLCESGAPPQRLFPAFVKLLTSAVGAHSGAVWFLDDSQRLVKLHDSGTNAFLLDDEPSLADWRRQLIGKTLASGESAIERAPGAEGKASSLPTVAVAALHRDHQCAGVVELFFRGELRSEARVSVGPFLEQMCGFASRAISGEQASAAGGWPKFLEEFEALSLLLHRSLDPKAVAVTAANDGRALLGCQRVSVAVQRGRKTRVTAISGQEGVNRKSSLVRAMADLMKVVGSGKEPLFFQGRVEALLPSLTAPLMRYLEENGSQTVAVVPLLDHAERVAGDEGDGRKRPTARPRKVIGCLVIDGPVAPRLTPRSRDAIGLLADHAAAALANAQTYRRIFLLPVWRFLGRRWDRFRGWTMVTTMAIVALLVSAIAAMVFVPWSYRVPADGRLMPVDQREVFAPWDGDVVTIAIRDGQRVKKGDVLLTVRSDDLRTQQLTTRNDLNKKRESILALQAQLDDASKKADRDEETRLQGELAATQIEIEGLEKQLKLWEERESQLTVTAPIDGVVATFRVEQLLMNRPVRRGDLLLEVMEDEGAWRLELNVPEHRMGHLMRAQRDLKEPRRPVEFVLATMPELTFEGQLDALATRTSLSEKEGAVVEAYATVDAARLPARNIGAEVTARIDCGERSLGYVLFGDFIEWIRRTLWL